MAVQFSVNDNSNDHGNKQTSNRKNNLYAISGAETASFPQVLVSSGYPAVPNPILESQVKQSFSLLPRIPILALVFRRPHTVLNRSLLYCSGAARSPGNQGAFSTCDGPLRWHEIARQRKASTATLRSCQGL